MEDQTCCCTGGFNNILSNATQYDVALNLILPDKWRGIWREEGHATSPVYPLPCDSAARCFQPFDRSADLLQRSTASWSVRCYVFSWRPWIGAAHAVASVFFASAKWLYRLYKMAATPTKISFLVFLANFSTHVEKNLVVFVEGLGRLNKQLTIFKYIRA